MGLHNVSVSDSLQNQPDPVRAFAFDSGVTITFLSAAAGCSGADFRKEYYVEERLRLLGR